MENKVDNIDFINSINSIIQEFTKKDYPPQNDEEILSDVYVCFSYEEVLKTYNMIDDGNIDLKPVIHYSLQPIDKSSKTYMGEDIEGERNYFTYFVYTVVNENYESNKPRYQVLNKLAGQLKYKFDNYRNNLDEFHIVNISSSEGILGENSDNLYACHQELTFRVDRRL
ncbi:MAG: hypothetical protein ACQEQF_01725 [Bacillota bacterium]